MRKQVGIMVSQAIQVEEADLLRPPSPPPPAPPRPVISLEGLCPSPSPLPFIPSFDFSELPPLPPLEPTSESSLPTLDAQNLFEEDDHPLPSLNLAVQLQLPEQTAEEDDNSSKQEMMVEPTFKNPQKKNKKPGRKRKLQTNATQQPQDPEVADQPVSLAVRIHKRSPFEESGFCVGMKDRSELPTEDSLSPGDQLSFPGLAGMPAYFKFAHCTCCKQNTLVFSFGDCLSRRKVDRFFCVNCVMSVMGDHRFTNLLFSDNRWAVFSDKGNSRRTSGLKEPKRTDTAEKLDEELVAMTEIFEAKTTELQWLLRKMLICLQHCKDSLDTETKLLAMKFLKETVEQLLRLGQLQRVSSVVQRLEYLDPCEQTFVSREITRTLSSGQMLVQTSRKNSEADLVQLLNGGKWIIPSKKHSFFLEPEERTDEKLGKRDSARRVYDDYESQTLKALFDSAPLY